MRLPAMGVRRNNTWERWFFIKNHHSITPTESIPNRCNDRKRFEFEWGFLFSLPKKQNKTTILFHFLPSIIDATEQTNASLPPFSSLSSPPRWSRQHPLADQ
jgi:hypothetical protein